MHAGYPLTKDLGTGLGEWADANPPPWNFAYWPDSQGRRDYGPINDIEDAVGRLERADKPGKMLEGLLVALCGYFNRIRCDSAPLYRRFSRDVVRHGDVIITLNYDVSLERELRQAGKWEISNGYGFEMGISGLRRSPTRLLKLHGSTNWMRDIGKLPVIPYPQDFEFLGYEGISDPKFDGFVALRYGAMIPLGPSKQFFVNSSFSPREGEEFWSSLWGQAADALREAEEVVIIGYSLPKADARARLLLLERANHDAQLTVCSASQSKDLAGEFAAAGFGRVRIRSDVKTFEELFAIYANAGSAAGSR